MKNFLNPSNVFFIINLMSNEYVDELMISFRYNQNAYYSTVVVVVVVDMVVGVLFLFLF